MSPFGILFATLATLGLASLGLGLAVRDGVAGDLLGEGSEIVVAGERDLPLEPLKEVRAHAQISSLGVVKLPHTSPDLVSAKLKTAFSDYLLKNGGKLPAKKEPNPKYVAPKPGRPKPGRRNGCVHCRLHCRELYRNIGIDRANLLSESVGDTPRVHLGARNHRHMPRRSRMHSWATMPFSPV